MKKKIAFVLFLVLLSALLFQFKWKNDEDDFVYAVVNPKEQSVNFYFKNQYGTNFGSIANLKSWLGQHKKELLFAMNGGMYKKDRTPQGLYIENGISLAPIDRNKGNGNFYLQPNGVFYLDNNDQAVICTTEAFQSNPNIKYATQSGPMLVIDGQIHQAFKQNSPNVNIRNGVGILPNNKILFAMSKKEINFYAFAEFFKNKGCTNALYLDGFVSRAYYPKQKWIQTDGDFGVIIGVTEHKK